MNKAFSSIRLKVVAVLAVALLGIGFARDARAADALTWTRLAGSAVDVSVNAQGQAYVVGTDGTPWRWDRVELRWRRMSGTFRRITAAEDNRPWGVDTEGVVRRYNGLWWEDKDKDVVDVAADTAGNVYIAKADGSIRKWYPLRSEWRPFEGTARRIAVGADGKPWVVTPSGEIRSFDGKAWATWPGRAGDIAVGGSGAVVIADAEGRVRVLLRDARRWDQVPGVTDVVAVAMTPDGGPWAVTRTGTIMITKPLIADPQEAIEQKAAEAKAQQLTAPTIAAAPATAPASTAAGATASAVAAPPATAAPAVAALTSAPQASPLPTTASVRPTDVDPAAVTTTETITFTDTLKTAEKLAIGKDGSVFALQVGDVARWSNARKTFDKFPGALVRLAVDPDGRPWGVSALGRVFRHTGSLWQQIYGATGAEIAIGGSGTVMIADSAGALYRLNSAATRFDRISGNGALIAVGPKDVPWAVRSDGLVQRCDTNPCTVLSQKAKSLSVGPDGSVWIVSDRDLLMRLKDDGKTFGMVPVAGHTPASVAAGPNGYPWVVTSAGKVLSSHYFERDESDDRKVAASTAGDTVGTGESVAVTSNQVSGFTFSKNMQFTTVGVDVFSSGLDVRLEAGNDGQIWGTTRNEGAVYDEKSRKFVAKSLSMFEGNNEVYDFAVTKNGDAWAYVLYGGLDDKLFRERSGTLKEYSVSGYTIDGVAVAPDDTVYAIFTANSNYYVYKKPSNSETFTRLSNDGNPLELAVGPANDLWIVSQSSDVYQWTGSKFEKRPAGGQKAKQISAGADGTVYILDTSSVLRKWNAANKTFDKVNNATGNYLTVDDDGRPWINVDSTPIVKRAK